MQGQFHCDLPVKLQRLLVHGGLEPRGVTPMRQPMHQLRDRQNQRVIAVFASRVRVRQPLDEFPIVRRKKLLLMRGARGQFDHVLQRPKLLTSARTHQVKLHSEPETRGGIFSIRLRLANDAQRGARRIEVHRFRREQPMFQFANQLLFLLGFFHLRESVQIGMGG